jgi:hypothetical protein
MVRSMKKGPYPEDSEDYLRAAKDLAQARRMEAIIRGLKEERLRHERHRAAMLKAQQILERAEPTTLAQRRASIQRARKILGEE